MLTPYSHPSIAAFVKRICFLTLETSGELDAKVVEILINAIPLMINVEAAG